MYNTFGKEGVESYLNNNQFAYRTGGSCTNALLKIQHEFLQALDSNDNRAVRLFTMDFSKAFDRVKHNFLIDKLTQSRLNPYIFNCYVSFLSEYYNRHNRLASACPLSNLSPVFGPSIKRKIGIREAIT